MKKVIKLAVLPAVLLMNSGLMYAAAPGAYVGVAGGVSAQQERSEFNQDYDSSFSGRVFAGFNFNRYLGLEANYAYLGTARYLSVYNSDAFVDSSLQAVSVVGKIYLPLSKDSPFNLYAFAGAAQMNAKYKAQYRSVELDHGSDNGIVGTGGLGVSYDINRHLTSGIELTGYGEREPNDDRLGTPAAVLATLSIAYKF